MKKYNKLDNNNGLTSTYIVTENQTIYDVAIDIHGTIDGISDILVNNPNISIDSEMYGGLKIIYTSGQTIEQDVVEQLDAMGIIPVNPVRYVYPKKHIDGKVIDIYSSNDDAIFSFKKSGYNSSIYIDWGDDTDIEKISPCTDFVYHQFNLTDNIYKDRRIRIYTDKDNNSDDLNLVFEDSNHYEVILYQNIKASSFTDSSSLISVDFLRLFSGIKKLSLENTYATDLTPISKIESLIDINLPSKNIKPSSLDALFLGIINNYGQRMPATININVKPTGEYREPQRLGGKNLIIDSEKFNDYSTSSSFEYSVSNRFLEVNKNGFIASAYRIILDNEQDDYFYSSAFLVGYDKNDQIVYKQENYNTGGAYSRAYSSAYNSYNIIEKFDENRCKYMFNYPENLPDNIERFAILFNSEKDSIIRNAQFEVGEEVTEYNPTYIDDTSLEDASTTYIPKNGMEAIWVLVNEESWNSDYYKWKIIIDGVIYTKEK